MDDWVELSDYIWTLTVDGIIYIIRRDFTNENEGRYLLNAVLENPPAGANVSLTPLLSFNGTLDEVKAAARTIIDFEMRESQKRIDVAIDDALNHINHQLTVLHDRLPDQASDRTEGDNHMQHERKLEWEELFSVFDKKLCTPAMVAEAESRPAKAAVINDNARITVYDMGESSYNIILALKSDPKYPTRSDFIRTSASCDSMEDACDIALRKIREKIIELHSQYETLLKESYDWLYEATDGGNYLGGR